MTNRSRPHHVFELPLLALTLLASATGQDDLRDRVEQTRGKDVVGRVAEAFGEEEILVQRGGKRIRVPRERVKAVHLLRDKLEEFNARSLTAADNPKMNWMLAEWADAEELPKLAAVQAHRVLLLEPDHREAHERLGHREHKQHGWLWPEGSRWLPRDEFVKHHSEWGRAFTLESETFRVQTNAGLDVAVYALLDLERLHTALFTEFGAKLGLREVLEPIELQVHSTAEAFPSWGFAKIPYYVPPPHGDFGATWAEGIGPRPHRLFEVGTQALLHRCLARGAGMQTSQHRLNATAELGFARWMETRWSGPAGRAEIGPWTIDMVTVDLARSARKYGVENLLHLGIRDHFYGGPFSEQVDVGTHWAAAHAFVAYLLDEHTDPDRSQQFFAWLKLALAEGKGDSSSVFDDAFGIDVEELEGPFEQWLELHGAPKRPKRRRG